MRSMKSRQFNMIRQKLSGISGLGLSEVGSILPYQILTKEKIEKQRQDDIKAVNSVNDRIFQTFNQKRYIL